MRPRPCAVVLTLLLTSSSLPSAQVRAQPAAQAATPEARAAFEQGRDAYDAGRFAEALAHFERAYTLSEHPKLLFNVARAADGDGQVERAIQAYESFLQAVPSADNREFVEARLTRLRASRAAAAASGARPAPTAAVVPAPAAVAAQEAGASTPAPARAAPPVDEDPRRPVWKSPWLWVAVGVVVAGGATAAVLLTRDDDAPEAALADQHITALGVAR